MSAQRFLEGLRVVDLSMGWAGPLAARHLADLGAEVIKVEGIRRFDWCRGWEPDPEWIAARGYETSPAYNMINRNKLAITIEFENAAGKALLERLVAISDLVVENYSSGVLPKLGLDYERLSTIRPDLIMVSMPAFGGTGPWKAYRAYGSTVELSSGLPHLQGTEGTPPTMLHNAYGDAIGGLNGAAALLTALRHRARTGEGQHIDLSQVECMFPLAIHGLLAASVTGSGPERIGNRSPRCAPWGVFPALGDDAWVVVQVETDAQFSALAGIVQGASEPWNTVDTRLAQVDAVEEWLAAWTATRRPMDIAETLQALGITAAPVLHAGDSLEDEQVSQRGFWQMLEREIVGVQPNPSPAYRHAGEGPMPLHSPSPLLGQHNRLVLIELLGLSNDEIAELERDGVIGDAPPMTG